MNPDVCRDPSVRRASSPPDREKDILEFVERLEPVRNEMKEIEPGIRSQLDNYLRAIVRLHQETYEKVSQEDREKKFAALYFKLWQFFYSREERLNEIKSPEIREIIKLKRALFPNDLPKWVLCIDGRVVTKLAMGLHGNSLKTAAGDLPEVVPNKDFNKSAYLVEGEFSGLLDEALENNDVVNEVYDSHVGCAAGGKEAIKKGGLSKAPEDGGLMMGVVRKKEIEKAVEDYVTKKYGGKKSVVSFHTSFNVHNGFMYMGLEKDDCLDDKRVLDHGYSQDVLDELVEEGKILSTQSLLDENGGLLRKIFEKFYFEIDYRGNYKADTISFWQNIKEMNDTRGALSIVENKIMKVFPGIYGRGKNAEQLTQRAMILLANAYSGFLHNTNRDGSKKKYIYGDHDESVIAVTKRENGPFDRARGFNVFPESPTLSADIDLAHGIVQGVRRSGKFSGSEAKMLQTLYPGKTAVDQDMFQETSNIDIEAYVNNPVAVLNFGRLDKMPSPSVIETLQKVDWGTELEKVDWLAMNSSSFFEFLEQIVPEIPSFIAKKINTLRKTAIDIYKRGEPATAALLDGRLAPIWTLCGPDRETIAMIPFVTRGY